MFFKLLIHDCCLAHIRNNADVWSTVMITTRTTWTNRYGR